VIAFRMCLHVDRVLVVCDSHLDVHLVFSWLYAEFNRWFCKISLFLDLPLNCNIVKSLTRPKLH
jgi:hypothetical protein